MTIEFYRSIPPLAYLPLIVILFDIDEFGKVLLAYLAIFAPIAISMANGGCNVDTTNFRATQAQTVWRGKHRPRHSKANRSSARWSTT
jgi:ABC-type nitrate/sulfonate/bicarbonate transport system permease component